MKRSLTHCHWRCHYHCHCQLRCWKNHSRSYQLWPFWQQRHLWPLALIFHHLSFSQLQPWHYPWQKLSWRQRLSYHQTTVSLSLRPAFCFYHPWPSCRWPCHPFSCRHLCHPFSWCFPFPFSSPPLAPYPFSFELPPFSSFLSPSLFPSLSPFLSPFPSPSLSPFPSASLFRVPSPSRDPFRVDPCLCGRPFASLALVDGFDFGLVDHDHVSGGLDPVFLALRAVVGLQAGRQVAYSHHLLFSFYHPGTQP